MRGPRSAGPRDEAWARRRRPASTAGWRWPSTTGTCATAGRRRDADRVPGRAAGAAGAGRVAATHRARRHGRGRRAGAAAAGARTRWSRQREALRALGVDGGRPPLSLAATDPAGYVRALAAARRSAELTDPAGLGGHWWLLQPVGVDARRAHGTMTGMTTDAGDLRELTVGTGAGAGQLGTDMVLNIGPQHPSTHGVLRLKLVLDGERVVTAEPIVGYMHRGAEKLFEVRDYRQIIVLANRHDWLSAFCQRAGRGARRRAADGHGGAGAGRLAAHRAGRAEPGAQPPDVPRLVPAGDRRDHPGLLRVPRAGDASRR